MLIVTNVGDGRRYRLVIKGALGRISGAKIKKYMVGHVGGSAKSMILRFNGNIIYDETTASDASLRSGDNIMLEVTDVRRQPASVTPSVMSSSLQQIQLMEAESLDDQRGLFHAEARQREGEFARTLNDLAVEMTEQDRQAAALEMDLAEKQAQVKRLEESKASAAAERRRLEDLRVLELEKQKEREHELQLRQQQLMEERERHREIELQRIELDRKQQLLEQQKMEAELERQRVERDRREYEEEMARQENEVRERETRLERERLDHERRLRDLERDKATLSSKKLMETETFQKEKDLDQRRLYEIQRQQQAVATSTPTPTPVPIITPTPSEMIYQPPVISHHHQHHQQQQQQQQQHHQHSLASPRSSIGGSSPGGVAPISGGVIFGNKDIDCESVAQANLADLAQHLGQPLVFDSSQTCVVDVDSKHTIMVSYDKETERLYIYSSLLCNLPKDPMIKLQLYETLLEGSLLGRDMAGGGVGLSMKDDFILMCTSLSLHACQTHALRLTVPVFSESLRRWRKKVKDLLVGPSVQRTEDGRDTWRGSDVAPSPSVATDYGGLTPGEHVVIGVELTDGVTIGGVHTQYNSGVIVVRVKGPAAAGGILENDIIKSVNNKPVNNLTSFQDITGALTPDIPAVFAIERNGQDLSLTIRPERGVKRPGEQRKYRVADDIARSRE